jgi:hypothetical protein
MLDINMIEFYTERSYFDFHQFDTSVAEFHKKGKCTHRQLKRNDAEK